MPYTLQNKSKSTKYNASLYKFMQISIKYPTQKFCTQVFYQIYTIDFKFCYV